MSRVYETCDRWNVETANKFFFFLICVCQLREEMRASAQHQSRLKGMRPNASGCVSVSTVFGHFKSLKINPKHLSEMISNHP